MHAILHLHIILILLDINSILYYDIIIKLDAWCLVNISDESEITQKLHNYDYQQK